MAEQNTGSFMGNAGGGGGALAAAMSSRGMNPGILNQIGGGSPNAPDRLPPAPVGAGAPSAVPQQRPSQQGIGQPPSPAESETIVKALSARLKRLGDLTEAGFQV